MEERKTATGDEIREDVTTQASGYLRVIRGVKFARALLEHTPKIGRSLIKVWTAPSPMRKTISKWTATISISKKFCERRTDTQRADPVHTGECPELISVPAHYAYCSRKGLEERNMGQRVNPHGLRVG